VLDRYPKRGVLRWYLIFGLTDETYSLVTAKTPERQDSDHYYLYLTALNQCYWVLGCGLGSSLQSMVEFDSRGFEFALVALFLVLLIEQIRAIDDRASIFCCCLRSCSQSVSVGGDRDVPSDAFLALESSEKPWITNTY
jgi:4-azaleucine resistance transporter AzlC